MGASNPFAILEPKTVVDPVCGMQVEPARAAGKHSHEGVEYHFCSVHCLNQFQGNPGKYLSGESAAEAMPGGEYTCPMHPEVVQVGPGTCPLCGMALEPKEFNLEEEDTTELDGMTRRLQVSVGFTAPLFVMAMGGVGPVWLQALLATPVVLWCGWVLFERGWAGVVNRSPNMFTLITMGTGVAYGFSVFAVLFPGMIPAELHGHGGEAPVYFEAAAVIITLVLLGQVLELRARRATSSAIRGLLGLTPKTARRIEKDGERDVAIEDVHRGDRLRVRPGERVPVDGVVVEGESAVDESMITGEATPAGKTAGSRVTGGTMNGTGGFVMEAERVGAETLLAQIVRMVNEAQRSRAPIQRLADRVAGWFVPAVVLISGVTFVVWSVFGPEPAMAHALVNAISVLIIACPCALGLATPMSIMVGTGRGAVEGVLIRNAEALEVLSKVDTLVVDKTGTLTEGRPKVVELYTAEGVSGNELLAMAAGLEQSSEHPLAEAVMRRAGELGVAPVQAENFQSVTGQGVTGMAHGEMVLLGNGRLMEAFGVDVNQAAAGHALRWKTEGWTVIYVARGKRLTGLLAVADPIKASTREALDMLRGEGLRIVMLTGDSKEAAGAVARQLGIEEVEAEVLPGAKHEAVSRLVETGHVVAMAGDGVNDAPALARAQVGIAMGNGADIAMESASVTLVKGDLRGIVRARRLSAAVVRNIRENLFFAFFYNLLGVPVAAGLLYPFFGILLSPMMAAAAMTLSSVSVIGNALRLRRARL
ncbi:MAG: heavy metal translocating P-type ATPase [Acidobacteriia bacterium]|nr:heavy metal translocating P-type ATPase [Terriglobia bacterium]